MITKPKLSVVLCKRQRDWPSLSAACVSDSRDNVISASQVENYVFMKYLTPCKCVVEVRATLEISELENS